MLNLDELFNDKKYIICVTPDQSFQREEADLSEELDENTKLLSQKNDKNKDDIIKRIQSMEKNTRT